MQVSSPRSASRLNSKLDAKLIAYMAAGMGTLAAANPAQAKIVYTAANISVGRDAGEIPIDINGDGLPDFFFSNYQYQVARFPLGFKVFALTAKPALKANGVIGFASTKYPNLVCASALPQKDQVGPNGPFPPTSSKFLLEESTGSAYSTVRFCPWAGPQSHKAYLGVRFKVSGLTHYGWIRMDVGGFGAITVTGYAYETVPNKPISTGNESGAMKTSSLTPADQLPFAPQPASLGMLARGAGALTLWRREESAGT
jgi:hypothetical protein